LIKVKCVFLSRPLLTLSGVIHFSVNFVLSPLFIMPLADVRRKTNSFDMHDCVIKTHLLFAIIEHKARYGECGSETPPPSL